MKYVGIFATLAALWCVPNEWAIKIIFLAFCASCFQKFSTILTRRLKETK